MSRKQQSFRSKKHRSSFVTLHRGTMKQIDFALDKANLYQIAVVAVQIGEPPRDNAGTRVVASLTTKLAKIGTAAKDAGEGGLVLTSAGSIVLESAEFAKLTSYVETAPILNARVSEKVALMDHLAAAKDYEAVPVPPAA